MSDELVPVAAEIAREHEAVCQAAQSAIEHARRAGELLLQAKAAVPHGDWLPWLQQHCPTIPERTAQAYMRVARHWPELEARSDPQRVADLPVRQALGLLGEPREQPEPDDEREAEAHPIARLAVKLAETDAEQEADEAALARCEAILAQSEQTTLRTRSARPALLRELGAVVTELRELERRALMRRLHAERAIGLLMNEAAAQGWTWARELLDLGDEAFSAFLDLCEAWITELETAAP